jgi:hypothetical protein
LEGIRLVVRKQGERVGDAFFLAFKRGFEGWFGKKVQLA